MVIAKNDDAAICTGSGLQIWLTGSLWIKYLWGALGCRTSALALIFEQASKQQNR
jgi:hypothetical protein